MSSNTLAASVAAEVRAECARQRMSGRELARRIGRPTTTVSRWLNGDTPISIDDLGLLAEALGVQPAELLARAALVLTGGRGMFAAHAEMPAMRPVGDRRPAAGFRCTAGPWGQRTAREVHATTRPIGRPNRCTLGIHRHTRAAPSTVRATRRHVDAA